MGPFLAMSGLPTGIAEMPVRNPLFRLSPTVNDEPLGTAIFGFRMGCGLIIRRLKKKGPKKGSPDASVGAVTLP